MPGHSTPPTSDLTVSDRVADAARQLADEPTLDQTLQSIVDLAVEMVEGCSAAGITHVLGREITTTAATDPGVRIGDRLQYELDEGPCLDAVRDHELVHSPDIVADDRWPRWAPAVEAKIGVKSMLAVQLYTSETTHGALNLYSTEVAAFTPTDISLAASFAAVAAAAMQAAQTEEQLTSAVLSRTVIGQAQGIVMERFDLSAENAFSVLSRLSQDSNTKLVQVAQEIVSTRRLPGAASQAVSSRRG